MVGLLLKIQIESLLAQPAESDTVKEKATVLSKTIIGLQSEGLLSPVEGVQRQVVAPRFPTIAELRVRLSPLQAKTSTNWAERLGSTAPITAVGAGVTVFFVKYQRSG